MLFILAVFLALVSAVPGLLPPYQIRPALEVPACPTTGTVSYNTSVPDGGLFPLTQVDVCYDDSSIHIKFTAFEERSFFCVFISSCVLLASIRRCPAVRDHTDPKVADNQSLTTNGEIYNYEVMEAFIVRTLG